MILIRVFTNFQNKQRIKSILKKKSSLLKREINYILDNPILLRHYKWFLNTKGEVKEYRKKLELDNYQAMKKHILYQDPSGKTKGCGCKLCVLRNIEKREYEYYKTATREFKKLQIAELRIDLLKGELQNSYTMGYSELPLTIFEEAILNKVGFKVANRRLIKAIEAGTEATATQRVRRIEQINVPSQISSNIKAMLFNLEGVMINRQASYNKYSSARRNIQKKALL